MSPSSKHPCQLLTHPKKLPGKVRFMAEFSHISMEFDEIVSVTLDNYEGNQNFPESEKNGAHFHLMQNPLGEELLKKEGPVPSFQGSLKKVSSLQITNKVELVATIDTSKRPSCWSKVCLHNMAELAKEATTMRRVLEPLFRNFDNGNLWSREKEIAYAILSEIQVLMEKSEQNSHLLLSLMVKHLDHKNVTKQPNMQIDIVNVATCLAQDAKLQASIPIVAEISDLIRHLRKCLEASSSGGNISRRNSDLHSALEECLLELTNKAFPEGLFQLLLLAMAHPDHERRVGSHRVFSAILLPSVVCPWSVPLVPIPRNGYDSKETPLVALSSFSSSRSVGEDAE